MANVTVTIRVVDDAATPAPIDGVLVRVFDDDGDTYITEGTTGAVVPGSGEVDFTLFGNLAGVDYTLILSKSGVNFPPAPTKTVNVKDPPAPSNIFQFTGHVGLEGQVVTFSVKDESAQPVEGVKIRLFDAVDTYITEFETDVNGEGTYVLEGSPDPGTQYIARLTPPAGALIQNGPTQTFAVLDPVVPPNTNTFDFVTEALPSIPVSPDPDMCRISGYFSDSSKRPINNLSLIFHPREGYPDFIISGAPFSGEPSVVGDRVVASDRRVNADRNGYVEFDLPRGSVFDVYIQGMDAPDSTLLAEVYIPDAAGIEIQEVLYPYVKEITYGSDTITLLVGETVTVSISGEASNLMELDAGDLNGLVEFLVGDESLASIELTEEGELAITGLAAGATTLLAERKPGTAAPRRPSLADILALPAVPTITVS